MWHPHLHGRVITSSPASYSHMQIEHAGSTNAPVLASLAADEYLTTGCCEECTGVKGVRTATMCTY
jgi:hypothetical protein